MEFIVPLKEKKLLFSSGLAMHLTASFCLLFSGLVSAVFGLYLSAWPAAGLHGQLLLFAGVCVILAVLIFWAAVKGRRNAQKGKGDLPLTILETVALAGAAWLCYYSGLRMPAYLVASLGIIVLVAALIRRKTGPAGRAVVSENGVRLDQRDFPWHQIERLLVRKGNFTLEDTRNRLFQRELLPGDHQAEAVEAYSAAMIEKAMPLRQKEW